MGSIMYKRKSESLKNVRFAPELTTVRKFDSDSEPISISSSNQSSPELSFSNTQSNALNIPEYNLPPILFNPVTNYSLGNDTPLGRSQKLFRLGVDDEDEDIDDNDADSFGDYTSTDSETDLGNLDGLDVDSFDIVDCNILDTNLVPFSQKYNLNHYRYDDVKDISKIETMIFNYLNGSNIKLHNLQKKTNKLKGLIYVNNLNFEKFIEVKFSFNNWKDIHYATATYNKSITDHIDEFRFTIDVMTFKYILKSKGLIYCDSYSNEDCTYCDLSMDLCCRYDVNNETYYDNNNYKNYHISMVVVTAPNSVGIQELRKTTSEPIMSTMSNSNQKRHNSSKHHSQQHSFQTDFLTTTTLSHNLFFHNNSYSRRFSDDTDYYNTSPLKHLYHNDTTLIKPTRINEVLNANELESPQDPNYDAGFLETHSYNYTNKPITTNYNSTAAYIQNTLGDMHFHDSMVEESKTGTGVDLEKVYKNNLNFQFLNSDEEESHNPLNASDLGNFNLQSNTQPKTPISILKNNNNFEDVKSDVHPVVDLSKVRNFTLNPNNSSETLVIHNFATSDESSNQSYYSAENADDDVNCTSNNTSPSDTPSSEVASILNSGNSLDISSVSDDAEITGSEYLEAKGFQNTMGKLGYTDNMNTLHKNPLDYQSILNSYCFYEPRRESYNSTCYDGDDDYNNGNE